MWSTVSANVANLRAEEGVVNVIFTKFAFVLGLTNGEYINAQILSHGGT